MRRQGPARSESALPITHAWGVGATLGGRARQSNPRAKERGRSEFGAARSGWNRAESRSPEAIDAFLVRDMGARSRRGGRGAAGEPWCEGGGSNPHEVPHWILNPARLPIPPLSQRCERRAL